MSTPCIQSDGLTLSLYGQGDPSRLFIGGLAYAPEDYAQLAELLPGTNIIAANPQHTGEQPWDPAWLRRAYAQTLEKFGCTELVAHSLGCRDAIAIAQETDHLQRIILLCPPLNADYRRRMKNEGRLQQHTSETMAFLDCLLGDLCADMSDEQYRAFLTEHHARYGTRMKEIYKKGMPKPEALPGVIAALVEDIKKTRAQILAIICGGDMWAPPQGEPLPDFGAHVTVQEIPGGHYPHRVRPGDIAATISQWTQAA